MSNGSCSITIVSTSDDGGVVKSTSYEATGTVDPADALVAAEVIDLDTGYLYEGDPSLEQGPDWDFTFDLTDPIPPSGDNLELIVWCAETGDGADTKDLTMGNPGFGECAPAPSPGATAPATRRRRPVGGNPCGVGLVVSADVEDSSTRGKKTVRITVCKSEKIRGIAHLIGAKKAPKGKGGKKQTSLVYHFPLPYGDETVEKAYDVPNDLDYLIVLGILKGHRHSHVYRIDTSAW